MNKNRRYDVDAILHDIKQGTVRQKIADKYGCSKSYIDELARLNGLSKARVVRPARYTDRFVMDFDREWRKVTGWFNEQIFKKEKAADAAE